ncbi:MAG: MOSC domain-containing protein [Acidimicrobiia bacterium]|nr:MOSC domain-containing protein [Acidimicrobiia bacterium]
MGIGSVSAVWRHPAKSMQGDTVAAATIGSTGMLGDRAWAVRDEEKGGIRGAKKIGALMDLKAQFASEPTADDPTPAIEITLPDGTVVGSGDPDVNERLSAALDRKVSLWPLQAPSDLDHYRRGAPDSDDLDAELRGMFGRLPDEPLPDFTPFMHVMEFESPPGTYLDAYPIHVLTEQSLQALQVLNPASTVDVRRFRPNLVLDLGDGSGERFPELGWTGRRLRIGEVVLDVVYECPRCVMITRPFADLEQDRPLLRSVVKEAGQNVGVYANVVQAGVVRPGDEAELLPA